MLRPSVRSFGTTNLTTPSLTVFGLADQSSVEPSTKLATPTAQPSPEGNYKVSNVVVACAESAELTGLAAYAGAAAVDRDRAAAVTRPRALFTRLGRGPGPLGCPAGPGILN